MKDELLTDRIGTLKSVMVVDKELVFRIEAIHGFRSTPGLSNIFQAGSVAGAMDQTNRARRMGMPIQAVIADINIPLRDEGIPVLAVSQMMELCKFTGMTICLIAEVDENGRLEPKGGFTALKTITPKSVEQTEKEIGKAPEDELFQKMRTSHSRIFEGGKDSETYAIALHLIYNAATKRRPIKSRPVSVTEPKRAIKR